jgi:type I restriction enzyme S subunit
VISAIGNISCFLSRGISPKYDDKSNDLVINQKCIRDGKLNLSLARKHSKNVPPEKMARFGDVLINSTGVGTLGRVAQVYQELKSYTVDSHVSIVRPDNNVSIDYFGISLMNLQSHFEGMGAGSTGQTELSRQRIDNTRLLLPPRNVQDHFSEVVGPMRYYTILMLNKNENLRKTRDLLLPKLISGEIDISDINIEVPQDDTN